MSESPVRIENVSKLYRIGAKLDQRSFRETFSDLVLLRRRERSDDRDLWALRDVSFEVRQGEATAIIGQNGAGKSTLLKILSRITEPTSGRILVRGRVSSLLEVGTGFHAELTGRENIQLNGAILGMTRREITQRFDEIVAFAEVERFIDTPVKYYSSGMYMRLAFAVAAHLEPEVLVVDEVLAVGDAVFQAKCLRKMNDVASHGRTVLFVSHNMPAVRALCQHAVWLSHGRIIEIGDSGAVVSKYLQESVTPIAQEEVAQMLAALPLHPVFRLTGIRILQNGKDTRTVFNGDPVDVELRYEIAEKARDFHIYFRLVDSEDIVVLESILHGEAESLPSTDPGRWVATARIPANFLAPAPLRLRILAALYDVHILPQSVVIPFDVLQSGVVNRAFPGYVSLGKVAPLFEWKSARTD
ncbi:MAG TPA: polysaccharide ABC transporter ATP-binding protein [Thermoanaerobaculia bacterium]